MWSSFNKLMIGLTVVICVVQMVYWFGRLPDPVPSHFDGAGQVDGQMSKFGYFVFIGLMQGLFLIGFPVLGSLLKRIPDSMLNIPNKEYWLTPERREETLSLNSAVLGATGWMSSWLMIGIFQLTALFAIKTRESIYPEFYWMMGIYLVGITGVVTWLLLKFRLPGVDPNVQVQ